MLSVLFSPKRTLREMHSLQIISLESTDALLSLSHPIQTKLPSYCLLHPQLVSHSIPPLSPSHTPSKWTLDPQTNPFTSTSLPTITSTPIKNPRSINRALQHSIFSTCALIWLPRTYLSVCIAGALEYVDRCRSSRLAG